MVVIHVLQKTQDLVILLCYFVEDGHEIFVKMYNGRYVHQLFDHSLRLHGRSKSIESGKYTNVQSVLSVAP